MTRALVFDLDGTLVDSLPGIAASLNRALAAAGLPTHPLGRVRRFIGNGVAMLVRRALPDDPDDGLVARLVDEFRVDYAATWADGTRPYPGTPAALDVLTARSACAVWSNKPHDFTLATVSRMFPDVRFAAVIGEREGIPRKPDPASAAELVAALGCPTSQVALVGDSTTDLAAARNAGFAAVAVTWGYHDRDQLAELAPDRWVDHVRDLPQLVESG